VKLFHVKEAQTWLLPLASWGVFTSCCIYCHHCYLQTCGTPYHLGTQSSSIVSLFIKQTLHTVTANAID